MFVYPLKLLKKTSQKLIQSKFRPIIVENVLTGYIFKGAKSAVKLM
jgi:hypothetical protein